MCQMVHFNHFHLFFDWCLTQLEGIQISLTITPIHKFTKISITVLDQIHMLNIFDFLFFFLIHFTGLTM